MTAWAPHQNLLAELARLDGILEGRRGADPDPDLLFSRAAVLQTLGRMEEAKAAYLEVLKLDSGHVNTLTQLAALLHETGYRSAAITVYRRLIALKPGSAQARAGLGHVLWEHEDHAGARLEYEAALALDPDCPQAHQGMASVLHELRLPAEALEHARRGYAGSRRLRLPYFGSGPPLRLLVLGAATTGNAPVTRLIDDRTFLSTLLFVEFHDPREPLPAHDLVFNAVGDADTGGEALARAGELAAKTRAAVLNRPGRVALTGRSSNARRLAGIPGLRVPRTADFSRAELAAPGAARRLEAQGFAFPLLLRALGFHAGKHFQEVPDAAGLAAALAGLPGDAFSAIEFLDARGADGWIRKYRAMLVGGRPYPLHAAVSRNWKVHYFSADMRGNPAHRAEDEAFLNDMPGTLGPGAMAALERIRETLGLDYAGADFSLDARGVVLFYEANATMIVPRPEAGPEWDYRREPVRRIHGAVDAMLRSAAAAGAPR